MPSCQLLTIVTLDGTCQKEMAGRSRRRSDRSPPGNVDIVTSDRISSDEDTSTQQAEAVSGRLSGQVRCHLITPSTCLCCSAGVIRPKNRGGHCSCGEK